MLDPADPGRLVAVLDWEMTTIGDPLVDLGLTLTYWCLPEARAGAGMDDRDAWWWRDRMGARYGEGTGSLFDLFLTAAVEWAVVSLCLRLPSLRWRRPFSH